LTLTNQEIVDLIDEYDRESKAIRKEALKFAWYMRGGISYNEAMALSSGEREIISKIIKENIEATEKSGLALL
jgi:hypothetical protein